MAETDNSPRKCETNIIDIQNTAIQFISALSDENSPVSLISQYIIHLIFEQIQNETLNIIHVTFTKTNGTLILSRIRNGETLHENIVTKPKDNWLFMARFVHLRGDLYAFGCAVDNCKYVEHFSKFTRISNSNWKEECIVNKMRRMLYLYSSSFTDDNSIYIIGKPAFSCGIGNNEINRFDPITGSWQKVTFALDEAPPKVSRLRRAAQIRIAYYNITLTRDAVRPKMYGILENYDSDHEIFSFDKDERSRSDADPQSRCIPLKTTQINIQGKHPLLVIRYICAIGESLFGIISYGDSRYGNDLFIAQLDLSAHSLRKLCVLDCAANIFDYHYDRVFMCDWMQKICLVYCNRTLYSVNIQIETYSAKDGQSNPVIRLPEKFTNLLFAYTSY
ncbi:MAG: hypothetical protein M0R33_19030 [Methylomonas sp.]|jgi:hypothetical protein|uniref:hypothetical protein n=1 Tax=Methylomonas sp. TaxID=418 RepID=UPI0025E32E16|nr:hypothetical protein [Methylomonas sp.]MCK9608540.1 hypothetical protein [Methylomonas sp.]